MFEMGRRELLQGVALILGVTAIPATALSATSKSSSLNPYQLILLDAVADTLIPDTDSPGATGAGVPKVFDAMLTDWAAPAHRQKLIGAIEAIDAAALAGKGRAFARLSASEKSEVLRAHDAANFAPGTDYRGLRDLIVTLYFFSETGATKSLRYEHAPGAFEPSLPLTPATRASGGMNVL